MLKEKHQSQSDCGKLKANAGWNSKRKKGILFQRAGVLHRCVTLTLAPLSHSFSAKRATSWRWCPTVCSWRLSWPLISSAFPPQREVTIAQTDKSHNFLLYARKSTQTDLHLHHAYFLQATNHTVIKYPLHPTTRSSGRTEEGEFSVTACMHSLYITLCST